MNEDAFLPMSVPGFLKAFDDRPLVCDVDAAEDEGNAAQPRSIEAATASPFSVVRSKTATLTPAPARATALAWPRPEAPPVTTAAVSVVIFICRVRL